MLVLVATAALAACATPVAPNVERMQAAHSPAQAAAQNKGGLAYSILLVGEVTGEPEAGNIQSLREAFWLAMCESLENSRIFRATVTNGKGEYRLDAVIVSHREMTGALFVTSSVLMVRYKLTNLATERVVWRQSFTSHFDSSNDLTAANEGAVHDNLSRMIDRLAAFSLTQARAGGA